MTKTIKIEGMMCAHCSGRVEKALNDLPGVTATVDLEAGTATVRGGADDAALTKAVTDAGCTVVSIRGPARNRRPTICRAPVCIWREI